MGSHGRVRRYVCQEQDLQVPSLPKLSRVSFIVLQTANLVSRTAEEVNNHGKSRALSQLVSLVSILVLSSS